MVVFGDLLMVQKSTKKSPKTTTNPRDISGLETILHLSSVQDFFSGTWRYQTWSYYLPIGSMHGIFTYILFDFYGTWRQLYMDPKGYSYRFWEQLDTWICDSLGAKYNSNDRGIIIITGILTTSRVPVDYKKSCCWTNLTPPTSNSSPQKNNGWKTIFLLKCFFLKDIRSFSRV